MRRPVRHRQLPHRVRVQERQLRRHDLPHHGLPAGAEVPRHAAADVPEDVRDMEASWIGIPKQVIDHVGDVLDRPIMGR